MRRSVPLLLAAALACATHDVDTRPFHLTATLADGRSVEQLAPSAQAVLQGVARRRDDTTLVVENASLEGATPENPIALGDVTIAFRRDAAPDVVFPTGLDGQAVNVLLIVEPGRTGPAGEPLPILAMRVATGQPPSSHGQLILVEFTYSVTAVSPTVIVGSVDEDIPWFEPVGDASEFEPARCGPVYYDVVRVTGDGEIFSLRRGERREAEIPRGDTSVPPWKILHVLSWHRKATCENESEAWTQEAAWR